MGVIFGHLALVILFVMAYHNRMERERFQRILDHWHELVEMKSPFRFLFVDSLGEKLQTDFPHDVLEYKDLPLLKRFQRTAWKWAFVAQYVEENMDCTCWFWWEWDVLPVQKDCFEFFRQRWTGSCRVMGYHVKDNKWGMRHRINGVAFYARDYWSYFAPSFDAARTFDTCKRFDPKTDRNCFVELNRWYCLVQHEISSSFPFALTPGLRLVHGIKNESLLEHMLGERKHFAVRSDTWRALRYRFKLLLTQLRLRKVQPPER